MTSPEVRDFVEFLEKERNDSPHTVKAYGRDLADFVAFCGRYYGGAWSWAGVDRLAIRAWLGAQQQRGHARIARSEEHTSELQSPDHLVCRLLLEKKKKQSNLENTAVRERKA